jgi:hypothetical protein
MTFAHTSLTALVAALAVSTGSTASATSYRHIDELALELQRLSSKLRNEFKLHYRHAAHYGHLRNDATEMYQLAAHVHELAHHRRSLAHIDHDLNRLDALFHHLEELVAHIEHDAHVGHGHVDGHTGHVEALMTAVENTLHHLHSDVQHLRNHQPRRKVYHPHGGHGSHVGHGRLGPAVRYEWSDGAVTVGRGGIRIRIGH